MFNSRWTLLGFVVVALALTGCNITNPLVMFGTSEGVVANEANATVTVDISWIPPHGTDGYRDPVNLTAYPRGCNGSNFFTPALSEGEYRVTITETATGHIVKRGKIFIPQNDGDRNFAYEEVPGAHPPIITMYHWGVVVAGTHPYYNGTKISS